MGVDGRYLLRAPGTDARRAGFLQCDRKRFWLFLTGLRDRAAEWPALRPVSAGLVYYVSTPDPTKMGGKFGGSTVVVLRYAACLLKRSAAMTSGRRSLSHSKRWQ